MIKKLFIYSLILSIIPQINLQAATPLPPKAIAATIAKSSSSTNRLVSIARNIKDLAIVYQRDIIICSIGAAVGIIAIIAAANQASIAAWIAKKFPSQKQTRALQGQNTSSPQVIFIRVPNTRSPLPGRIKPSIQELP